MSSFDGKILSCRKHVLFIWAPQCLVQGLAQSVRIIELNYIVPHGQSIPLAGVPSDYTAPLSILPPLPPSHIHLILRWEKTRYSSLPSPYLRNRPKNMGALSHLELNELCEVLTENKAKRPKSCSLLVFFREFLPQSLLLSLLFLFWLVRVFFFSLNYLVPVSISTFKSLFLDPSLSFAFTQRLSADWLSLRKWSWTIIWQLKLSQPFSPLSMFFTIFILCGSSSDKTPKHKSFC